MNTGTIYVTPSEVIEYLFCPRFTYYLNVLDIKQHEDRRNLVLKGRRVHEDKTRVNKDYLRKKLGTIEKVVDVYLSSETIHAVGVVDEIHFLEGDKAIVLDYKYAFWKDKIYKTHVIQQAIYALLIEEQYKKKVEKAYIVYTRSNNKVIGFPITDKVKQQALEYIQVVLDIINKAYYPEMTHVTSRCSDCCYRNLCGV